MTTTNENKTCQFPISTLTKEENCEQTLLFIEEEEDEEADRDLSKKMYLVSCENLGQMARRRFQNGSGLTEETIIKCKK